MLKAVAEYTPADATAIIDGAISDFVGELNRALRAAGGGPFELSGTDFLSRYDALWAAKRNLAE